MISISRIRRKAAAGIAVATALLAASLVVGLGTAGAAQKDTTLRVLVPSSGLQLGFSVVAKNFERANPGIKVQLEPVPSATYGQVLLTQLQAGTAPDVIYTNGGGGAPEAILPLAKAGRLVDLSGRAWAKRVPDAAHDLYFVGKKLYALPLDLNPLGVVYNVSQFQAMGLKPPTTFAGLLSLCKTIKDKGRVPISVPGQFPRLLGEMLAANYVYSANPQWNAQRAAGKTTFAGTPGWNTSIQRFVDMNSAGCFTPGVQAVSVPQSFSMVGSGQALMYTGPASGMGGIQQIDPSLKLAMFPLPGATVKSTRVMAGEYDAVAVNATSSHKAEALKLVDFFAREGQSRLFAKVAGGISLHDANVGNIPSQFSALTPFFKAKKVVSRAQDSWPSAQLVSALDSALIGSITGQLSIDAGLKGMDDTWAKAAASN